jgi:hypothetical protein
VTVTVARDDGHLPDPDEYAQHASRAASGRAVSIMSAHTAGKLISIVTVVTADQQAAVAVALAVVSEALRRPVSPSSR